MSEIAHGGVGTFITKDSGKREAYDTGAKRDTQEGKIRWDLIPLVPLKRLAELYTRGAAKYDEWNWAKGIKMSRCYASAFRHLMQWAMGFSDEDHLAAVVFNVFCIMHYQDTGRTDLDDMQQYRQAA